MMVCLPSHGETLLPQLRGPQIFRSVAGVLRGLIDSIVNTFLQAALATAGVEGIMVGSRLPIGLLRLVRDGP